MLLILDLDETLLHAREEPLERPADFQIGGHHAYKRPHLNEFLEQVSDQFELAVWTSATKDYANVGVAHLCPEPQNLCFVWSRERCTQGYNPETFEHYWVKDLKKVKNNGFDLEQTLALDDSPEKLERNYGNWVPIRPFYGDETDLELRNILPFLEYLSRQPKVRRVEKRH